MKKTTNILLFTALSMLFLSACSPEDLMQDNADSGKRGWLHVTEVSLPEGGMQSRAALENGNTGADQNNMPFNVAATGFDSNGDLVTVNYSFGGADYYAGYLNFDGSEWNFQTAMDEGGNLYPTRPNQETANGESWANFSMQAYTQFNASYDNGTYNYGMDYVSSFSENNGALLKYFTAPAGWEYDSDNGRYTANGTTLDVRMYLDKLAASTEEGGGITADTDLSSPTLGSFSVALKHAHAMLRLPKSAITTEALYIDDKEVTPALKTLWAELSYGTDSKMYIPLTEVTLGGNTEVYQAIVPVKEGEDAITLTGFQMVYTDVADDTDNYTHVFDISGSINLSANTRYPLSLTLSPRKAEVALTAPEGKPGWTEDETIYNNDMNEALNEVTYTPGTGEAAGTFIISGGKGLQLVNRWMAGNLISEAYAALVAAPYNWPGGAEENRMKQNITLEEDITLPATDWDTGEAITLDEETGQPSGSNWIPLGGGNHAYSGTFNGNDNSITGLRIVSDANNVGLVNVLDDEGTVQNLTLTDAVVHSTSKYTDAGKNSAGLMVGLNSGRVNGCVVSGSSVKGMSYVGLVVGHNYEGEVNHCVVNPGSSATGLSCVGAIVGHNASGGTVSNCINQGSATATGYSGGTEYCYAGGIVGANTGTGSKVSSCQNQSSARVSSDNYAGGIAGENSGGGTVSTSTNAGTVEITSNFNNTFASGIVGANYGASSIIVCGDWGTVTGAKYVGGIVGNHSYGTATACWTTQNKAIGFYGGTTSACYYQGTAASNEGDESKYGTGVQSVNTDEVVNAMNESITVWNTNPDNTSNTVHMKWVVSTNYSYPGMELITN